MVPLVGESRVGQENAMYMWYLYVCVCTCVHIVCVCHGMCECMHVSVNYNTHLCATISIH